MVSGDKIQVAQDERGIHILFKYAEEPQFTLEQEKALHEIAVSFLLRNRAKAKSKRSRKNKKN